MLLLWLHTKIQSTDISEWPTDDWKKRINTPSLLIEKWFPGRSINKPVDSRIAGHLLLFPS